MNKKLVSLLLILLFLCAACTGLTPEPTPEPDADHPLPTAPFVTEPIKKIHPFASGELIKRLSESKPKSYLMGPGDVLSIKVWRRPELNNELIVVSPDGTISLPRIGIITVKGRTVQDVTDEITRKFSRLYKRPEVNITLSEFHNNKAFVLGRVVKPGVVNFPGDGTLLEALALAGGLPYHGKETFLTKCAIIRGNDMVIWIDLTELLKNGNMALNAAIYNNDVIFIPASEEALVYVMGEVIKPGAIPLRQGVSLVQAIMMAGGFTKHAKLTDVYLIRPGQPQGVVRQIDLGNMLNHAQLAQNFTLQDEDIIYISPKTLHRFNYIMEELLPAFQVLFLTTNAFKEYGVIDLGNSTQ
jgi:polysaccharide export outer membrane protein